MRRQRTRTIANVRVGEADVKTTAPTHVWGVFQGNHPHRLQRHKGVKNETPNRAEGTPRRSTGIRPDAHAPIDPRMPKLSPA